MRGTLALLAVVAACGGEQRPTLIYGVPRYGDLPRDVPTFECDTAAGRRSEVAYPIGTEGHARGAVFLVAVREGPASANVLLRGPQDGAFVSLTFTVDEQHRHLQPQVRTRTDGSAPILSQPLRPRPIRGSMFELEWESKMIRVRLEPTAPWLEVPIAFAPDQLKLGCTTAEAVFHSTKVESEPPPGS